MKKWLWLLLLVVVSLVLALPWIVDGPEIVERPENVMSLEEVLRHFNEADGWVALPLADSKYEAGAIVRIDANGIRRISHLRECRYPDDLLAPAVGLLPQLISTRQVQFGAQLVATMDGVRLGPEGRRARAVGVQMDSITAESLDPIRIAIWEDEGQNFDSVPAVCRQRLSEPDMYVVGEAVRINRGSYTFYDSAWSVIEARAGRLSELVDADASARVEATEDGSIVITSPVTIAIRTAYWAGDGFRVLGPDDPGPRTADSLLAAVAERRAAEADSAAGPPTS